MNTTEVYAATDGHRNGSGEFFDAEKIISNDTLYTFMKAAYSGVIPAMAVTGLIFNVFSFILLCPMKERTSTNVYLIGLTVCDVLILLCALLFTTVSAIDLYVQDLGEGLRVLLIPVFNSYIYPLQISISNYLITLIAVDRFIAVVFPLKVRLLCGRRFAITAVVASYVITAIVSLPLAFLYETKEINNTETGEIVNTVTLTTFGKDKNTVNVMFIVIETAFRFTPVVLVAAASVGTIISFNCHSKNSKLRKHNLPLYTQEIQITKTLLSLTMAFLFCNLPSAVTRCIMFFQSDVFSARRQDNFQWMLSVIWYALTVANSCINFPIYVITCREYRVQFLKIMYNQFKIRSRKYEVEQRSGPI